MSEKIQNKINSDPKFDYIIKDILNSSNFNQIKAIKHHNSTDRFSHCLNVSYRAYKMARLFKCDTVSAARGGLLHDYFFENSHDCNNAKERINLMTKHHSEYALINSKRDFLLNEIEEDAIISHMYPVSRKRPKYKESWIVLLADDFVSIGEKNYSFRYAFNILTIFIVNSLFK